MFHINSPTAVLGKPFAKHGFTDSKFCLVWGLNRICSLKARKPDMEMNKPNYGLIFLKYNKVQLLEYFNIETLSKRAELFRKSYKVFSVVH